MKLPKGGTRIVAAVTGMDGQIKTSDKDERMICYIVNTTEYFHDMPSVLLKKTMLEMLLLHLWMVLPLKPRGFEEGRWSEEEASILVPVSNLVISFLLMLVFLRVIL